MREFIINENDAGQRADKFIAKLMPRLPKSMMYKGFRKSCVKLNGRHIKDGAVRLCEGDELKLYFADEFFEPEKEFKFVRPRIDAVYEDENILVVNKAAGVVVHADERGTENTLIDMVLSYLFMNNEYDPKSEQSFKPALCNRLDRNTSGLVIAAKNAAALREMNERIRRREVRKFYYAVVEGYPEREGHLEGYVSRAGKVTAAADADADGAKAASLDFKTVAERDGHALLEIELHTGRTHQIRAQLAAHGFPLAGDTKYGGHGAKYRQSLCAARLQFDFKGEPGVLSYLDGKEIAIENPFDFTLAE